MIGLAGLIKIFLVCCWKMNDVLRFCVYFCKYLVSNMQCGPPKRCVDGIKMLVPPYFVNIWTMFPYGLLFTQKLHSNQMRFRMSRNLHFFTMTIHLNRTLAIATINSFIRRTINPPLHFNEPFFLLATCNDPELYENPIQSKCIIQKAHLFHFYFIIWRKRTKKENKGKVWNIFNLFSKIVMHFRILLNAV